MVAKIIEFFTKKYYISWKSKLTDHTGNGIVRFPKNIANDIIDTCNRRHSDIIHWYLS